MSGFSDTIGAVNAGVAAQPMPQQAVNQGMALAQTQQDVQQKQLQTQQMQEQLQTAKFNTLNNNMQLLARSRPEVAKKLVPAMQQRLQQSGIAVDPGILDLMASDEDYKRRMVALSSTAGQLGGDQGTRQQFLQAHQDIGDFDKGLSQLEGVDKEKMQGDIAKQNADKALAVARIGAGAKVEAAQIMSGPKAERIQMQGNRLYSQEMGKADNMVLAANKVQKVIADVDTGTLNSNKTIKGEIQKNIAQLLSNGAPSTVYGESAIAQDSYYEHLQDLYNKSFGTADSVVAPAQWEQMKKDIAVLQTNAADQHAIKYNSFREGLEGSHVQQHLDARYNKFREQLKLGGKAGDTVTNTPPPMAAGGAQDPGLQMFLKTASSHPGYNEQAATAAYQKLKAAKAGGQ